MSKNSWGHNKESSRNLETNENFKKESETIKYINTHIHFSYVEWIEREKSLREFEQLKIVDKSGLRNKKLGPEQEKEEEGTL